MQVVKYPNKILSQKLKEIREITPKVRSLISDMRKKMVEALGIGLAASQVGEALAIFVIDKKLAEENKVPDAYINPEITECSKDKFETEEGCLSLPEYFAQIPRSKKIKLKALDENGNKIKIKARGFLARVIQHEIDHLNGILINNKKH